MLKRYTLSGFSLIEFGIVLMLGLALMAFLLPMFRDHKLEIQKKSILNQHVNNFKMLVGAAERWKADHYETLLDDSSGEVSVQALKTGGYLPVQFAFQYSNSVPYDMLGIEYKLYWNKGPFEINGVEKQIVKMIITTDGAASWQSHPETFVPSKFAELESEQQYYLFVGNWYSAVANLAVEKDLAAGRLKSNSHTVVGTNQSWKVVIDTTDFNVPQRPYQRAALFIGWPEINGIDSSVVTEPPNPESAYAACSIGRVQHDAWLHVSHSASASYDVVESSKESQCSGKTLIDFTTEGPSTQMINIPGWGGMFATVKKSLISNLGSLGSNCVLKGRQWCSATIGGTCSSANNEVVYQSYLSKLEACKIAPIYNYDAVLNLAGSEYKSYPLYQYGSYSFGRVGGTEFIVSSRPTGTTTTAGGNHHAFCCPADTPDLD